MSNFFEDVSKNATQVEEELLDLTINIILKSKHLLN